jgi:hypothetical protein
VEAVADNNPSALVDKPTPVHVVRLQAAVVDKRREEAEDAERAEDKGNKLSSSRHFAGWRLP